MSENYHSLIKHEKNNIQKNNPYTQQDALREFDEIKQIALNCYDKNGNPNISAALRAIENKAKISGLYQQKDAQVINCVKMNEITLNGEQLKLNIGEEYNLE